MNASTAALLLSILIEAICFESQGARCKFPSDWKGKYFQSGLGNVVIRDASVTTKGSCVDQNRDYFLFANTRDNNCFQCLLVIKRHQNVLQYRESFCLPAGSLKNICAQIRVETPLYTLVRDPSTSITCPFQDAYRVNYNDLLSGFCDEPNSYAEPCIGLNKYLFQFKHCVESAALNRKDFSVECLATWKDGSESYLYGRVTTAGMTVKDDQFRCFNYQHFGNDVFISMSADATCRGLRTARDGQLVMELTKDSFGWPVPSCRFPDWLRSITWRDLEGRQLLRLDSTGQVLVEWYQKKSKQYPQSEYRCSSHVTRNHLAKDVTLRSYSTHGNVIEAESNARCLFTDVYQVFINDRASLKATCPLPGIYQATVAMDRCVHRMAVGCHNDTLIDVASSCNGGRNGREDIVLVLECLITWRVSDKVFVIVRSFGGKSRLANCLSFTPDARPMMLELDRSCNKDVPAIDDVFQSKTFTKHSSEHLVQSNRSDYDCKYDFTGTRLQNRPSSPPSSVASSTRFTTEMNSNPRETSLRSPSDPVSRENQATSMKDPNFYDENDDYDDDNLEYNDYSFKSKLSTSSDDVTPPPSSSSSDVIDDVDSRRMSSGTGLRPPAAKTNWSSVGQSRVVGTGDRAGTVYISSHESKDDRSDFDRPLGNNFPYKITQQNDLAAGGKSDNSGLEKTRNNSGTEERNGRKRHGSASGDCPGLLRRLPGKILLFLVAGELTALLMLES